MPIGVARVVLLAAFLPLAFACGGAEDERPETTYSRTAELTGTTCARVGGTARLDVSAKASSSRPWFECQTACNAPCNAENSYASGTSHTFDPASFRIVSVSCGVECDAQIPPGGGTVAATAFGERVARVEAVVVVVAHGTEENVTATFDVRFVNDDSCSGWPRLDAGAEDAAADGGS
jgi:hypothetical protein